jgi:hypothetical protein
MNFIKLISIVLALSITSCDSFIRTNKTWNKSYYNDYVQKFLVTDNGETIILIGYKFHYTLSEELNSIKELLKWKNRSKLKMIVHEFDTESPDIVRGGVTLKIKSDIISKSDLKFLQKIGFTKKKDNKYYKKTINLFGRRYKPNSTTVYNTKSKLSREYKMVVRHNNAADIYEKVALTPIMLTVDGFKMAEGVPIINIPFVIANGLIFDNIQVPE